MQQLIKAISFFLLGLTCLISLGCVTHRTEITPLEGGYSIAAIYKGYVHVGVQIKLLHQDLSGKNEIVWKDFSAVEVKGDRAVFVGFLPRESRGLAKHVFLFQPPGPAVDITDQIWGFGAKQKGGSPDATATISTLKKVGDEINIGVAFTEWRDGGITLSWEQISDFAQEVKETGLLHVAWGSSYLAK